MQPETSSPYTPIPRRRPGAAFDDHASAAWRIPDLAGWSTDGAIAVCRAAVTWAAARRRLDAADSAILERAQPPLPLAQSLSRYIDATPLRVATVLGQQERSGSMYGWAEDEAGARYAYAPPRLALLLSTRPTGLYLTSGGALLAMRDHPQAHRGYVALLMPYLLAD